MSNSWFAQRERGSPVMLRIILWVAQRLGRGAARLLLYPITAYFLLTGGSARRASRDYLGRVLGRPATLWDVARHIHTFAATILDRVFFLTGRFGQFEFRFHGMDEVLELLGRDRGFLLLGAHLGSFEVLRVLALEHRHARMKVLMYPEHNRYLTCLFNSLNPEVAETVIPLGSPNALLKVHEALQAGEVVGMLGDRVAESEKVTRCTFLGEETSFPAGPMLLAGTLGVPVVLVLGLYRGGNRYDIHFEVLAETIRFSRAERPAVVQQWTQRYADRLGHYAKSAPYNWFNFYDYWDESEQEKHR
jgi:predicted LPLAT superfamily acyltransferase